MNNFCIKSLAILLVLATANCVSEKSIKKAIGRSNHETSERINQSEQNAEKNFQSLEEAI
jgi:hypothetical protein